MAAPHFFGPIEPCRKSLDLAVSLDYSVPTIAPDGFFFPVRVGQGRCPKTLVSGPEASASVRGRGVALIENFILISDSVAESEQPMQLNA